MAKKEKKPTQTTEADFYSSLAKSVGGELLDELDQHEQFVDTGILALNYSISGRFIGGGVPTGASMEIYGSSSSGKTLIGTNILKGTQKIDGVAVFLDAERTINKSFAVKASHVDPKKLIVMEGDTLESCFNKIFKIIRQAREQAKIPLERPIVIIYDSIAVSPSEREFAEAGLDLETATKTEIKEAGAGADKPGERAKICGKELRKLTPFLAENNATVVFLNQVRQKIGVFMGDDKTTGGGGMALPFYASTRIEMSSYKRLEDKNEKVLGTLVTVRNVKNKVSTPFVKVKNLTLLYDHGIDPFGGLLEVMLQAGRIEPAGPPGTYKVLEPWADGKDIKFKSAKDRNTIPPEILLSCPALVDGKNREEVEYYCDLYNYSLEGQKEIAKEEEFVDEN